MDFTSLPAALVALQIIAQPGESPLAAAARANKPFVQVEARFKSGPTAEFPEAARAAGEHGRVLVSAIVDKDGRLKEIGVAVSSRSAVLDRAAMSAAAQMIFAPALDDGGRAISVPATVPFAFDNTGSLGRYTCAQFVRDSDWWRKTWPADHKDDFYRLVLGYSSLAGSLSATGSASFESRWNAAIEGCRKTPDRLFVDTFMPEGDLLRRVYR